MAVSSNKPWYRQTAQEVLAYFQVDVKHGLSSKEALKRLSKFGNNNAVKLPKYSAHLYQSLIYRDAKLKKVNNSNIVIGDIVAISAGDMVPADLRLLKVNSLTIDESKINGGNHLAYKNTFAHKEVLSINEQKCMAFAGTIVVSGSGVGVVVNTSERSRQRSNNKITGIKNSRLAKKFYKKGLFVQNSNIFRKLKKVDTVLFLGNFDNNYIFESINKLQLQKNIHCLFILKSVNRSLLNALPEDAVYDPENQDQLKKGLSPSEVIRKSTIVIDKNSEYLLKIISSLKGYKANILIVYKDNILGYVIKAVNSSIVIGEIDDSTALYADIRALKIEPELLASILYNNK